ncbi:MAG TPA: hypothetical protein VFO19_04705 [Vicinamibacterales bacterium]|nr:hypothetical protein [Vicinamibacterales bacterium]
MPAAGTRSIDPLRLVAIGVVALGFAVACLTNADPDLWGHVRFGADIVHDRALPTEDPYSFTQDRPWINHEWLSELQMGVAWLGLGATGLALLKGLLVGVTAMLVWRALAGIDVPIRLAMMAVAAIGTTHVTQSLRPQVWSLLLATILFRRLSASDGPGFAIAILFALWANLHGGWVLGLIVLTAWAATDTVHRPSGWGRWVAILAACVAATLATPYGLELWRFLTSTVRVGRPIIEEWQPIWQLPWPKWIPWLVPAAAVVWAISSPFDRRWPRAFALAALAYGSLKVARVLPFFAVAAMVLIAPRVRGRWPAKPMTSRGSPSQDLVAAAVIFAIAVTAAVFVGRRTFACVAVDDRLPESAPAAMLEQAPPGKLVTFFDWGEYALWHLGPAITVSMDGRRETVYSDSRLDDHDAILAGTARGLELLAQWQPDYVWLPAASETTRAWLIERGYRLAFESPRSFLAVRADRAIPATSTPPDPDRRCFPQ